MDRIRTTTIGKSGAVGTTGHVTGRLDRAIFAAAATLGERLRAAQASTGDVAIYDGTESEPRIKGQDTGAEGQAA